MAVLLAVHVLKKKQQVISSTCTSRNIFPRYISGKYAVTLSLCPYVDCVQVLL